MVKLGIIGVGNMGTAHTKLILAGKCPEITVTAIADTRPERLAVVSAMYRDAGVTVPACYASGEELIRARACDAVILCVPHFSHVPLAVLAFENGLHVMCEKPAGVFIGDVRKMNEAAEKSGKVFGMMFNQRTDCLYRKVKEIIDSGEMGKIRRFNWIVTNWYRPQAYYDSADWRATWSGEGGGTLLNQCAHQIDLWQWFCGMPARVEAHARFGGWHDIETEDDVTAYAEYPDGASAVFVASTGDYPGTNRLEISFDSGKLVAENRRLKLWKTAVPEQVFTAENRRPFCAPALTECEVPLDGENPQHYAVLNAFAGAILRGTPLVARGEEGIRALAITNAMYLSAWTGKTVELPLDEDAFRAALDAHIRASRRKTVRPVIFGEEGRFLL